MGNSVDQIIEIIRNNIKPPSFSKEPQNLALSIKELLKQCNIKGIDISYEKLYKLITED